ncbi:MAG: Lrp/AsnC family transcriptional regulator [Candidatus Woesearchaeota archaeon]
MLDQKDQIILEALFQDATITSKELAKLAKITQPAAFNRVKKLEQEGYIWRYDAVLNWNLIPLHKKQYFCDLSSTQIELLSKQTFVLALFETIGVYTHTVWCFFQNEDQAKQFETLIPQKRKEVIIQKVHAKSLSLFDLQLPQRKQPKEQPYTLTKEDIQIFQALAQGGAKKSVMDLYKETGLSIDVIRYRKDKMIQNKLILYFLAQPGVEKLHLTVSYLYIQTQTRMDLSKINRVVFYFDYDGGQGIGFFSKDLQDYLHVISQVKQLYGESIEDFFVFTNGKYHVLNRYPLELVLE